MVLFADAWLVQSFLEPTKRQLPYDNMKAHLTISLTDVFALTTQASVLVSIPVYYNCFIEIDVNDKIGMLFLTDGGAPGPLKLVLNLKVGGGSNQEPIQDEPDSPISEEKRHKHKKKKKKKSRYLDDEVCILNNG